MTFSITAICALPYDPVGEEYEITITTSGVPIDTRAAGQLFQVLYPNHQITIVRVQARLNPKSAIRNPKSMDSDTLELLHDIALYHATAAECAHRDSQRAHRPDALVQADLANARMHRGFASALGNLLQKIAHEPPPGRTPEPLMPESLREAFERAIMALEERKVRMLDAAPMGRIPEDVDHDHRAIKILTAQIPAPAPATAQG